MAGGASKSTPFARAYLPWVAKWQSARLSGTPERVLLLLISRMESDDNGTVRAWYPREEMARELGVSQKTVSNAVQTLRKLGFLEVDQAGFKGLATVYKLMPDCPPKVPRTAAPKKGKGTLNQPPKVPRTAAPLRSKDSGRADRAAAEGTPGGTEAEGMGQDGFASFLKGLGGGGGGGAD